VAQQGTLNFAPARSRLTDPQTSYDAGLDMECSGRAGAQRRLCLNEVLRQPGQTAAEIAASVGLERHAPSRRLPELREGGLVRNGPARICRVMGRKSLTWWPRKEQRTALLRTQPAPLRHPRRRRSCWRRRTMRKSKIPESYRVQDGCWNCAYINNRYYCALDGTVHPKCYAITYLAWEAAHKVHCAGKCNKWKEDKGRCDGKHRYL